MGNIREMYVKGKGKYFTRAALARARKKIFERDLTHKQFAGKYGVSLGTVRDVLYGRSKATRGESYKIAVTLGLKKSVLKDSDFRSSGNLSPLQSVQPANQNDMLAQYLGSEPTETDQAKLEILRCYPDAVVKPEPTPIPDRFDFAALAQRHS